MIDSIKFIIVLSLVGRFYIFIAVQYELYMTAIRTNQPVPIITAITLYSTIAIGLAVLAWAIRNSFTIKRKS